MRSALLFSFFFFPFLLFGQNGSTYANGARSAAMGNTGLNFNDINSLFNNQAGLADLEATSFLIAAERKFALADLNNLTAGVALPTSSGTFGISLNYFGFDLYNETKVGLAYSRRLMDKLSVGIQFDMLNTRIPEYGSKNLFTFEIGLQSELSKNLTLGFHLFNPVKLETVEGEYLPTVIQGGISYAPSKKVLVNVELEKDIDFPFTIRTGIEYEMVDNFWLRLGVNTEPASVNFGIGYLMQNGLRLDIASSYHQELGFTPAVSLGFDLKKEKK